MQLSNNSLKLVYTIFILNSKQYTKVSKPVENQELNYKEYPAIYYIARHTSTLQCTHIRTVHTH